MRQCVANELLTSCSGGNTTAMCNDDGILLSLTALTNISKPETDLLPSFSSMSTVQPVCSTTVYWNPASDLADSNALTYVAGYVVYKIK